MKQIIQTTALGSTTFKGARLQVRIGMKRYYFTRSIELSLDDDKVRVTKAAMLEHGYGQGGAFLAGWDEGQRNTTTYTRLPFEAMSLRVAQRMFEKQPAIENRDWFYY